MTFDGDGFNPPYKEFNSPESISIEPKNITIIRCQAEELSQGGALWIILVLAIGSAIHLPGSVAFLGRKGLYRLSPELSIFEVASFLILIIRGIVKHGADPKRSIQAALALRYFLGKGESWWLGDTDRDEPDTHDEESVTPSGLMLTDSEKIELLDPTLQSLRKFSHARMLCFGLTTLAFIKSCEVSNTVRTFVMALSYYIPFLIFEISVILLLEPPWPKSRTQRESEALKVVRLMSRMDPFQNRIRDPSSRSGWEGDQSPLHQRYSNYIYQFGTKVIMNPWKMSSNRGYSNQNALSMVHWLPIMLPSVVSMAMHIVWPISVLGFLLLDFQVVNKGKWTFLYLTWVPWVFWSLVVIAGLLVVVFAVYYLLNTFFTIDWDKWDIRATEILSNHIRLDWFRGMNVPINIYVAAKFGLTIRFFLVEYTGIGTKKAEWIDWLG